MASVDRASDLDPRVAGGEFGDRLGVLADETPNQVRRLIPEQRPDLAAEEADGRAVGVILQVPGEDYGLLVSAHRLGRAGNRVRVDGDAGAGREAMDDGCIVGGGHEDPIVPRQPAPFKVAGGDGEEPVRGCGGRGLGGGATLVEDRLDVVKVEDDAVAHGGERLGVGSAPEVLDDADGVTAAGDGCGDGAVETGEAIEQRGTASGQSDGITKDAGGGGTAVGGEIEDQHAAGESGWKTVGGIRGSRLAEDQQIGVVAACEVVQDRGGPESAAAIERVGHFGGEEERGRAFSGQSASGLRSRRRRWRARQHPRRRARRG